MFLIIISLLPILCSSYLELKVKSKAESQGHTLHVIKISSFHYRLKVWYCTLYYQMQLKEGSYKLYTKKTAKCDLENYNKIYAKKIYFYSKVHLNAENLSNSGIELWLYIINFPSLTNKRHIHLILLYHLSNEIYHFFTFMTFYSFQI